MDAITGDVTTLLLQRAKLGTATYGKGDKAVSGYTEDAKLDIRAARRIERAESRCNELYAMIKFLRENDGECIGDHPDWLAKIDQLLDPDRPQTAPFPQETTP
jgi:hypothetical protein